MATDDSARAEIESFLQSWQGDEQPMREVFRRLYRWLADRPDVSLNFLSRPGVSHSLRPRHALQKDRELFAIIDVIDDDPEDRWLSVCFYQDMISDPEQRGELIPGGLAGSDGYCFDLYEENGDSVEYLLERIRQAERMAARR